MQARRRLQPIASVCEYCHKEFLNEGYQLRKCCDRSCGQKLARLKAGDRLPWSEGPNSERELLESIAGTVPRHEITAKYNRSAVQRGFPKRNENAIVVKLKRWGLSQKTTEDNWRMSTLAELLGVTRDRVRCWVQGSASSGKGKRVGGKLPSRKVSNMTLISKADFIAFARAYPEKLKGIHPRNLSFVLQDEDLVYLITRLGRPTVGHDYKLIRVDTGEKFESGREAGRTVYGNPKYILRQTKQGKKAYGVEFKIVAIEGSNDYSHLADRFPNQERIRQQVEELRLQGKTIAQIARKLDLKEKQVKTYLYEQSSIRGDRTVYVVKHQSGRVEEVERSNVDAWCAANSILRSGFDTSMVIRYGHEQKGVASYRPDWHKGWKIIEIRKEFSDIRQSS